MACHLCLEDKKFLKTKKSPNYVNYINVLEKLSKFVLEINEKAKNKNKKSINEQVHSC